MPRMICSLSTTCRANLRKLRAWHLACCEPCECAHRSLQTYQHARLRPVLVLASRRLLFFFLSFSRRRRLHRARRTTRRPARTPHRRRSRPLRCSARRSPANARGAPPPPPNAPPSQATTATMTCSSKPGERASCAADTSKGVVLLRSTGEAPCLLGRTWGYDQTSVGVSDGCSAEFATGSVE